MTSGLKRNRDSLGLLVPAQCSFRCQAGCLETHLVRARIVTGASFLWEETVPLEKQKRMCPLGDCGCHMRPHEAALIVLILTHRTAVKFLERKGALARTPKLPRAPWEEGQVCVQAPGGLCPPPQRSWAATCKAWGRAEPTARIPGALSGHFPGLRACGVNREGGEQEGWS